MKKNYKDKQWDSPQFHDRTHIGYQRCKLKNFHTNEEARAIDKLYNSYGWHGCSDPVVDWTRLDDAIKKFDGKDADKFRKYVEVRTKGARKKGWSIDKDVLDRSGRGYDPCEIDGVLDARGRNRRYNKRPKVIKIPVGDKDIRWRIRPELFEKYPRIPNLLNTWLKYNHTNPKGFVSGHYVGEKEFREIENYLYWGWKKVIINYFKSVDAGYNMEIRSLSDICESVDMTEYLVLERGTKEFKKYFAEKNKPKWRPKKDYSQYDEDIVKNNKEQAIEKVQARWEKTKNNIFLIPND
jgi:hypothetical protein